MQKAVLKLDLHDDKDKKKAMKIVSGFAGVNSIDINMKDSKLTVTGAIDPVELVGKLRKTFSTDIISVGPAKEAQKKDDNKKDDQDKKKDDNKSNKNEKSKDSNSDAAKGLPLPYGHLPLPPPPTYYYGRNASAPPPTYYYGRYISVEEDPNGCVIC